MSQGDTPSTESAGADNEQTSAGQLLYSLLRQGRSISGHERNCCFLNTGAGRFADISSVSGLDFPDDGRAIALVDWDHDGDLDLWIANRTGPQVRFLRNDVPDDHRYLALRLVGRTCNRDAIGARVEVVLKQGPDSGDADHFSLVKTLRAGEGFLGQASKWLHFGLGSGGEIQSVIIHWPGGKAEHFTGVAANKHYRIVQGSGRGQSWTRPHPQVTLARARLVEPQKTSRARLPSYASLMLPQLDYTTFTGHTASVYQQSTPPAASRVVLLNLWASWCGPCMKELTELGQQQQQLRDAGLDVVALSIDTLDDDDTSTIQTTQQRLKELAFPFTAGMATAATVEKLQMLHDQLFELHHPLPVPTSFLIDSQGRLRVIYKGPVDVPQVLADLRQLGAHSKAWRHVSLPFEGRWFGKGVSPELVKLAKKFIDRGYVEDAHRYAANYSTQLKGELDYPQFLVDLGNTLLERGEINRAVPHYRKAIAHKPDFADAYYNLGLALQAQGNLEEATAFHRRALQLNPQLTVAHVELGRLQSAQGHLQKAVRHYRDALKIDPHHVAAHGNLGNALLRLRQVDGAINHFRQVLAIDQKDAIAHYNLGRALASHGKLETAVRHFRRSLEIRPDNARVRKMLTMSLKELAESRKRQEK